MDLERRIRRLRKKLRQIENLEHLPRELNHEEAQKVTSKAFLREDLADLLLEEQTMKRSSSHEEKNPKTSPKRPCPDTPPTKSEGLDQEEQLEISLPQEEDLLVPPIKTEETEVVQNGNRPEHHLQVEVSTPSHGGSQLRSHWRRQSLKVRELEGHEDVTMVADLSLEHDLCLTASRDTTALVWRLSKGSLLYSLRGHTSAVTGVAIVPASDLADTVIGLTSSLDCSIKVWNLGGSVRLLRNIYTYNSIKCLGYTKHLGCALSGTDGGKLELFQIHTGKVIQSARAHEEALTALDVRNDTIATGSRDGSIKVWQVSVGTNSLHCLFASNEVAPIADDPSLHTRCISTLRLLPQGQGLVFGDSGCNIKILKWKSHSLQKVPNHLCPVGFTDGMAVCGAFLLASSYDLDNGLGHVNMFHIPSANQPPSYICSWTGGSRIFGLAGLVSGPTSEELTFLTCGKEVKLWTSEPNWLPVGSVQVQPSVWPIDAANTLDSESSSEANSSEDEAPHQPVAAPRRKRNRSQGSQSSDVGSWWCNVM